MMKQTKFWILLFAALAILGCGAFLLLRSHGQTGQTAVIRVDGDVYMFILYVWRSQCLNCFI